MKTPAIKDELMLVLSRKTGQSIRIGDDIEITITKTQGNRVRIGIQAPLEVPVHRSEVCPESDTAFSVTNRGATAGCA